MIGHQVSDSKLLYGLFLSYALIGFNIYVIFPVFRITFWWIFMYHFVSKLGSILLLIWVPRRIIESFLHEKRKEHLHWVLWTQIYYFSEVNKIILKTGSRF